MTPSVDINYLAVFVAAIINMIIGSFWYSPLLFAKPWMRALNLDQKKMQDMKK